MVTVGVSLLGRGAVIFSQQQGWPVCGGRVMVQVKSSLSNILSNSDDENIEDRRGPVKTVIK